MLSHRGAFEFFLPPPPFCMLMCGKDELTELCIQGKQALSAGPWVSWNMFIKMFCFHMLAELATLHRVLISKSGEKSCCAGLSAVFLTLQLCKALKKKEKKSGNFPLRFFDKSHSLTSYKERQTVPLAWVTAWNTVYESIGSKVKFPALTNLNVCHEKALFQGGMVASSNNTANRVSQYVRSWKW